MKTRHDALAQYVQPDPDHSTLLKLQEHRLCGIRAQHSQTGLRAALFLPGTRFSGFLGLLAGTQNKFIFDPDQTKFVSIKRQLP